MPCMVLLKSVRDLCIMVIHSAAIALQSPANVLDFDYYALAPGVVNGRATALLGPHFHQTMCKYTLGRVGRPIVNYFWCAELLAQL